MEFTEEQIRYMASQELESTKKRLDKLEAWAATQESLLLAVGKLFTGEQELYGAEKKDVEQQTKPFAQEKTEGVIGSHQALLNNFPEDLQELITAEEVGDYWAIKPRKYLGAELFSKVNDVVKNLGGKYVSASKAGKGNQHWAVPK